MSKSAGTLPPVDTGAGLARLLKLVRVPSVPRLSAAWRFAAAPVATLLVFLIQFGLFPDPSVAPFLLVYLSVLLASWAGGRAPGLASVALTAALANFAFIEPFGGWATSGRAVSATAVYVVAASLVALLCASFRDTALSLQRERERFRSLVSATSEVLYRMSPDWSEMRQLHSQSFLTNTERPSRTWLAEYIHPDDQAQVTAAIAEAVRTKSMFALEHRVRRQDGSWGWTLSRAVPIMDSRGEITEWLGAAADVTDRRRAEQSLRDSEEQLRAIYEQNPAMVVLSELEDGRIIRANEGFTRTLGYSVKEALGRTSVELGIFPKAEDRQRVLDNFRAKGSVRSLEVTLRSKSGAAIAGLLSSTVIKSGGKDRLITVVADITDRKQAEEALRRANERLVEADRRKDEFLAVLSHELRNPLAPIRNSLYVLDHAVPGGEQARRAKAIIERQVNQMTRLVSDLLDVSRVTRGKVQLQCERIDLRDVVGRTLEDYRSIFVARGIELQGEQPGHPVWVNGDVARLGQALGNLLHNAAKFTNQGGTVSVQLSQKGRTAVLRVQDPGAGIAPDMLDRLFQPFTQSDRTLDRSVSAGGLGLGLALVKGLIELHGGEVEAHSEGIGKGAVFTLRIPAEAEVAPVAPSELPGRASNGSRP